MTNQELRVEVLRAHYELADGDPVKGVMRTDVAERLGINDYNDSKLMAAILYLADKGYFSHGSNITENLSSKGIDEYEQGFPALSPQKPTPILQRPSGYTPSDTEAKLLRAVQSFEKEHDRKLHTDVDMVDIAHGAHPDITKKEFEVAFTILLSKRYFTKEVHRQSIAQQKAIFPALVKTNHVFMAYATTYYSLGGEALLFLNGRSGGNDPANSTVNVYDDTSPYKARRAFEELFETAKTEVKIVDNYIGRRTLDLLLITKNVPIKIITKTQKEANFASALTDFQKEYKGTIEIKDEDKKFHGRFIIIDDQTYLSDHSIKNFAEKPSSIVKVSEPEINQHYIKLFDDTWRAI